MMLSEFQTLAGVYPSWSLWQEINRAYNESKLDKRDWCDAYVENRDGIAARIARLTDEHDDIHDRSWCEQVEAANAEIKRCKAQIRQMQEQLEAEQEWKPAKNLGTNMSEREYQLLADDTAPMSEQAAIRRITVECGFDPALIRIVPTVRTYDVSRHGKCRVGGEFTRRPVWSATDWNYIRFDVCGNQWEIVNGELMPYYD